MIRPNSWIAVTILILVSTTLGSEAWARGRGRTGFAIGFRGPGPVLVPYGQFGGFGPYRYGGGFYHSSVFPGEPRNYGRVDFNVHPDTAEVYVDGAYLGIADDFNGGFFGTTAALPAGPHQLRIVAPNGNTVERKIYVMPGREIDFDLRF